MSWTANKIVPSYKTYLQWRMKLHCNSHDTLKSWSSWSSYMYIYIYVCIYICVCIYMMLHVTALIYVPLDVNIWYLRAEPHIDFCMQYLIIALAGGVTITNDNLKFKKVMELESLCIVIRFPHIYLTIDVKG